MIRAISGLCAVLVSMSAMADEKPYEYMLLADSGKPVYTPYAGLVFEHHANISNTKPGIEAGVVINQKFFCGIYGQTTTGNFGIAYEDAIHNIMFGEAGVVAGCVTNYRKPVHFGGVFKIGYISLLADDEELKLFKESDPVAEDNGLVFHPEIFSEVNMCKPLKIRLGLGYSFNSLDKESVICNRDLDSWTMNLSLLFGQFWK